MKLVEVVMLLGAHCVSPVEHSQMMTEAGKVQCAAVVEKDTVAGTVKVIPDTAASDPKVIAVIDRFNAVAAQGTKIVPATAPAGSPPVTVVPPRPQPSAPALASAAPAPDPAVSSEAMSAPAIDAPPPLGARPVETASAAPAAAATGEPAPAEPVARIVVPPPQKPKPAAARPATPKKQVASAAETAPDPKVKSQCKTGAVAKWYTSTDGHKKYRCVRPEPASDTPTAQLY